VGNSDEVYTRIVSKFGAIVYHVHRGGSFLGSVVPSSNAMMEEVNSSAITVHRSKQMMKAVVSCKATYIHLLLQCRQPIRQKVWYKAPRLFSVTSLRGVI